MINDSSRRLNSIYYTNINSNLTKFLLDSTKMIHFRLLCGGVSERQIFFFLLLMVKMKILMANSIYTYVIGRPLFPATTDLL